MIPYRIENNMIRFYIEENQKEIAFLEAQIHIGLLVATHTVVEKEYEGKGYGQALVKALIDYAAEHQSRIIPLCPYVLAQFKRHQEEVKHLWAAA